MKNTGIFGGHGFIGSHLCQALPDARVFDGRMDNLNLVRSFIRNCDLVYHISGMNRSKKAGEILRNNSVSTSNLVVACRLDKLDPKVVFLSSSQVLTNLASEYGFAKSIEERMIQDHFSEWSIIRSPGVFGPRCKPFYNSVVATFCHMIVRGESPTIDGDGSQKVELMYVGDLIDKLLSPAYGMIYSPNGTIFSINELVDILSGKKVEGYLGKTLDWYRRQYEISGT